ncbi:MAG: hypothetical protein ACFFDF_17125 [Candidatus Odinarchaeota archaeon]
MKFKNLRLGIIIFLFIIIGISFVNAESKTLQPNQYWGLGKNLSLNDTLNFQINSNNPINVYIMDSSQISQYQNNPQDTASLYYEEWKGILLLTDSFTAPKIDTFYLLMINPSDDSSASISVSASIDYAEPEKSITIYSPRSTDIFDNGNNQISWTTTGDITYIRIELYVGNSFLEVIESWENNDGSYSWYLSSSDTYDGSNYRIRISDYYDDSVYAFSDYFTISITPESTNGIYIAPLIWSLIIIIPSVCTAIGVVIFLIIRRKRKVSGEIIPIEPQKIEKPQVKETPRITYCSSCGSKIIDSTAEFCSKCGVPIK